MTSQSRRDASPAELGDDQLAEVSGGPIMVGHGDFSLVSGDVYPDARPRGFTAPLGSGKGS